MSFLEAKSAMVAWES